ncbi:hypothetical protein Kisp01_43620 [Kineosporia sp. NBRC 101677]|nr:hypothetical protein Kisp01_43620 [Kineosporia sp. NBRC 101677]
MSEGEGPFLVAGYRERAELLRDGLAREVLDLVVVSPSTPITPSIRALAVREKLGHWETDPARGRSIGFGTAGWVLTGSWPSGNASAEHERRLDLIIGRNRRSPRLAQVRVRQIDVPAEHLYVLEGLQITTPVRTAADLARDLPRDEALPRLRLLQEMHDVHPPQVLDLLTAMPYARGAAVARAVVREWAEMA